MFEAVAFISLISKLKEDMKILRVAVCAARHPFPVGVCPIFEQTIDDPTRVDLLERRANARVWDLMPKHPRVVSAYFDLGDPWGYGTDEVVWEPDPVVVEVYATGLTVALLAVIKAAKRYADAVVVMHYDRETGNYVRQEV